MRIIVGRGGGEAAFAKAGRRPLESEEQGESYPLAKRGNASVTKDVVTQKAGKERKSLTEKGD